MIKKLLGFILGLSMILANAFMFTPYQSFGKIIIDPDGQRIICNCTAFANCKVSGSSGVCAQSQPGGNIQCSTYNSNC